MQLERKVLNKFIHNKETLGVAESCTGGLIASRLTDIPGSSAFFIGGVTSYHNTAKIKILGVPKTLLNKYGAVSPQVAKAMAQGVRKKLKTDYGLGVTGIAGPSGGSKKKPVGLVYIAVTTKQKTTVKKFLFKGTRLTIKKEAAQTALKMLAN